MRTLDEGEIRSGRASEMKAVSGKEERQYEAASYKMAQDMNYFRGITNASKNNWRKR